MGFQEILWTLENLPTAWQNVLDVALVSTVLFLVLRLARGTRAATLLRGIAVVLILVWALSVVLNLQAFSWLLSRTLTALAVALPVIFQEELRRWLDRVGRFFPATTGERVIQTDRDRLIAEVADAARWMAVRRHGALIVLERETGLEEYSETGVRLDGLVTSAVLQTIFYPGTTLHDGAAIIRAGRVVAAACTLPVSTARRLPDRQMGMRHRAALGISEVSDGLAVVVSEETGRISVVVGGRFVRAVDAERLTDVLADLLPQTGAAGFAAWINHNLRRAA